MAKFFPLSYYNGAESNDHGGTDKSKNLHYSIHDVNNQSRFTGDGSIDVYKFRETPSNAASPERAYALIIIKNTGAHNSHLNITDITLENATTNAGFSLISAYNQIFDESSSGDFGGSTHVLTPAQYQTHLNTLSPQGTALSSPSPLGYVKLNSTSGTLEETDFGGTSLFIPFYNPADIKSTTDDDGISANNLSGSTTYPEYAAFILKCNPVNSSSITGNDESNKLTIEAQGFDDVTFYLNSVAYRAGLLGYKQGVIDSQTFTISTENPVKTFISTTLSNTILSQVQAYTNSNVTGTGAFDGSVASKNNFFWRYSPIALHTDVKFFDESQSNKQALKISDTTALTGGVRLTPSNNVINVQPGLITTSQQNVYKNVTEDSTLFTYIFRKDDAIGTSQADDNQLGDINAIIDSPTVLSANENVYLQMTKNLSNDGYGNYKADQGNTDMRLLRPALEDIDGDENNFRPRIASFGVVYNPFYVNGNSLESTITDVIHLLTANYNSLSTDSVSYQKFVNSSVDLQELDSLKNVINNFVKVDRTRDVNTLLRQRIGGIENTIVTNFENTPKDAVMTKTPNGVGTTSITSGKRSIYKHAHIIDYFDIPSITIGGSETFNGPVVRYNNLSGAPEAYRENFNILTETPIDITVGTGLASNIIFDDITNTNKSYFTAIAATSVDGNTAIPQTQKVFANGYNTGVAWSSYTGNQYMENSKYKEVRFPFNFVPIAIDNTEEKKYSGSTVPEVGQAGLDSIGRRFESTSLKIQSMFDRFSGAVQASANNNIVLPTDVVDTEVLYNNLQFQFHANYMPEFKYSLNRVGGSTRSCWSLTGSSLFITEYAGVNKFGTHDASSTAREAINSSIHATHTQSIAPITGNSTSGNGEHNTSYNHIYASATPSHDYYFRKYPLNGRSVFKHEQYFNSVRARGAGTTIGEAYGILPGPTQIGRFLANKNAVAGYEHSHNKLFNDVALNSDNSKYEAFIPFNFKTKSNVNTKLVNVELENIVGNSVTGAYGDPRMRYGSGLIGVDASGNVSATQGSFYEVPASDKSANTVKTSPTNSIAKQITSDGSTTVTVAGGGMSGLKVGQILRPQVAAQIPTANTKIASINAGASTMVLTAAAPTATNKWVVFDFENPSYAIWDIVRGQRNSGTAALATFPTKSPLDFTGSPTFSSNTTMTVSTMLNNNGNVPIVANPMGRHHFLFETGANATASAADFIGCFVIPDATNARGIQPGTTITGVASGVAFTLSHATTGSGTASVRMVHPDRHQFNTDFVDNSTTIMGVPSLTAGASIAGTWGKDSMAITNSAKSTLPITNEEDGLNNTFVSTFYNNYSEPDSLTDGAPHIYFAASSAAVGTNDLTTVSFYNRLRIKYLAFNKLDHYGLNQIGITNNSIAGYNFTSSHANRANLYEDVYLVKANLTNTVPELQITDLEGDINNSSTVIDFGVISVG